MEVLFGGLGFRADYYYRDFYEYYDSIFTMSTIVASVTVVTLTTTLALVLPLAQPFLWKKAHGLPGPLPRNST